MKMLCVTLKNPSNGLIDPDLTVGQLYDVTPTISIAGEFYSVNIKGSDYEKPQGMFRPEGYVRPLYEIAREISRNWSPVYYAAAPYLSAMLSLRTINDDYGFDNGRSVVAYFLANASSWRGDVARRIKAELKTMLKGGKK